MAGVKGRSGGRRQGAGKKKGSKNRSNATAQAQVAGGNPPGGAPIEPASTPDAVPVEHDSLGYLRALINDPKAERAIKVRAAIALAQYEHQKIADGGVKPARQAAADKVGVGKFAPSAAPTLKRVA